MTSEHDALVVRRVWVQDWKIQCCGDPFEIGTTVDWTVSPVGKSQRDYWSGFLDPDVVATITDAEEHHAGPDVHLDHLVGNVAAISAVFHFVERSDEHPHRQEIVAGSGVLEPREAADGWEPEHVDVRFMGYLVDLLC